MGEEPRTTTTDVVLTSPLSLSSTATATNTTTTTVDGDQEYRTPNLLQRTFNLLKNVRPGSDLTRFQLPPIFNIPKSHLQCYGESVYGVRKDMLRECANGGSAVDRMIAVVAWSLSTLRPLTFGVAPYNPVLGETHHVTRGNLNVLLEQVSHHPPVSALHATDDSSHVELVWCHHPVPKFHGATIETQVHGQRRLKLLNRGETYIMNSPNLLIRLFPIPSVNWVGKVQIRCQETNLQAELSYNKGSSFFSSTSTCRSLKGKIVDSSSSSTLYEIEGRWDKTVAIKNAMDGRAEVMYDAKEVVCGLETPTVHEGVSASESGAVWAEVSRGILSKNWDKARDAKRRVEEKERELVEERNRRGEDWVPKHFCVSFSKELGWDCIPKLSRVPPAPIVYPTSIN